MVEPCDNCSPENRINLETLSKGLDMMVRMIQSNASVFWDIYDELKEEHARPGGNSSPADRARMDQLKAEADQKTPELLGKSHLLASTYEVGVEGINSMACGVGDACKGCPRLAQLAELVVELETIVSFDS